MAASPASVILCCSYFSFLRFALPKPQIPKLFKRKQASPRSSARTFGGRELAQAPTQRQRPNFGSKYRAQREQMRREAMVGGVLSAIKARVKLIAFIAIGLVIIIVAGLGISFLHSQEAFILKDIVISGNNKISTLEIVSELQHLKGQSLFSFNAAGIEQQLKQKFSYARDVEVRKVLPGTIEVEVVERFPVQARITQSGAYLVDEDRVVVEVLYEDAVPELTAEDRLVLTGYGNANSKFIQDRYTNKIEDLPEDQQIKWEVLSDERKQKELNEYRAELESKVEARLSKNKEALAGLGLQLAVVEDFSASTYAVGTKVEAGKFNVSNFVQANLTQKNYVVQRLTWRTNFALYVNLEGGMQLIFSVTKDPGRQILEFETVKARGDLRGVSIIDLRSNLIAVR